MQTVEQALEKLRRSPFRGGFHLRKKETALIQKRGIETIRKDAIFFIHTRLAPAQPKNDGRQTPMRGHPVFVAQHATACCCRKCLQKWYRVPQGVPLSAAQEEKIVRLIMAWIERESKKQIVK